jgi:hypothetical protein
MTRSAGPVVAQGSRQWESRAWHHASFGVGVRLPLLAKADICMMPLSWGRFGPRSGPSPAQGARVSTRHGYLEGEKKGLSLASAEKRANRAQADKQYIHYLSQPGSSALPGGTTAGEQPPIFRVSVAAVTSRVRLRALAGRHSPFGC